MKNALRTVLCLILAVAFTTAAFGFVSTPVKSIKLDNSKITMKVGQTLTLKVTITPSNATDKKLLFTTSNNKIATVDKNGKITAVKEGKAVITVVSSSNKKLVAKCNVTILQISKAPVQLNILGYYSMDYNNYSKPSKYTDWPVLKEIEKKTNVKLKWEMYDYTTYKTTVETMIASGSVLADIILACPNADNMLLNNKTIDWAPYIKEGKAPNLAKLFNTYPELKSYKTLDDGRIFAVPYTMWCVADNAYSLNLRKDWLDKLGLKEPATIDEFDNVLRAFRDKDPNGNGKKDEVPLITRNWQSFNLMAPCFGIKSSVWNWYFYTNNDKVFCTVATPQYRNYITWVNKLFKENLVDRSVFETSGVGDRLVTALKGNVLGGYLWDSLNVRKGWEEGYFKKADPNASIETIPLPKGPDIDKVETSMNSAADMDVVVMKDSKNIDAAVRFVDFNYSAEGQDLSNYGIEGDSYKVVGGKKVITDKLKNNTTGNDQWYPPEGYGLKNWLTIYLWDSWGQLCGWTDIDYKYNEMIKSMYTAKPFYWSNFRVNDAERAIRDSVWPDLKTFIEENTLKFITGVRPMSEWDAFVDDLMNKHKMQKIMIDGYLQPAYNRYLNDLEKNK